jgi:hypothetical protein
LLGYSGIPTACIEVTRQGCPYAGSVYGSVQNRHVKKSSAQKICEKTKQIQQPLNHNETLDKQKSLINTPAILAASVWASLPCNLSLYVYV